MLVGFISSASILIPLITGLLWLKRIDYPQKVFLAFIGFSTLVELVTIYHAVHQLNNLWVFKVLLTCEFFFFIWFFNYHYKIPKWLWVINALVFIALAYFELYVGMLGKAKNNFNYTFIIFFIFFIFQSAQMIIKVFEENDVHFNRNYLFWISFARLFYFLIILFIFIYPTLDEGLKDKQLYSWAFASINTIGNILMNILYSFSFICKKFRT